MEKNVLCVILMLSIVALNTSASVRENNITIASSRPLSSNNRLNYDNELSKIDAIRQRYYDLESEIWRELRKSANEAVALRKIHEHHLAFYGEQLEFGVDFSLFETGEKDLFNEVKFINDSVLTVTKKNLQKNERNFEKVPSLELAGRHREFIRAMDAINNITKGNDLFGSIKKVNIFVKIMGNRRSFKQTTLIYSIEILSSTIQLFRMIRSLDHHHSR